MWFGVLCTYAMAYGALMFTRAVVGVFTPAPVSTVINYITQKTEEFNTTEMKFRNGEGALDAKNRIVLSEKFPSLSAFDDDLTKTIVDRAFWLTDAENEELEVLLSPLALFEQWSWATGLSEDLRNMQRARSIKPVLFFLSRIPETRQDVFG